MKEYVENMKKYVENMKEYEEICRYWHSHIGSGSWENSESFPYKNELGFRKIPSSPSI